MHDSRRGASRRGKTAELIGHQLEVVRRASVAPHPLISRGQVAASVVIDHPVSRAVLAPGERWMRSEFAEKLSILLVARIRLRASGASHDGLPGHAVANIATHRCTL